MRWRRGHFCLDTAARSRSLRAAGPIQPEQDVQLTLVQIGDRLARH